MLCTYTHAHTPAQVGQAFISGYSLPRGAPIKVVRERFESGLFASCFADWTAAAEHSTAGALPPRNSFGMITATPTAGEHWSLPCGLYSIASVASRLSGAHQNLCTESVSGCRRSRILGPGKALHSFSNYCVCVCMCACCSSMDSVALPDRVLFKSICPASPCILYYYHDIATHQSSVLGTCMHRSGIYDCTSLVSSRLQLVCNVMRINVQYSCLSCFLFALLQMLPL